MPRTVTEADSIIMPLGCRVHMVIVGGDMQINMRMAVIKPGQTRQQPACGKCPDHAHVYPFTELPVRETLQRVRNPVKCLIKHRQ